MGAVDKQTHHWRDLRQERKAFVGSEIEEGKKQGK